MRVRARVVVVALLLITGASWATQAAAQTDVGSAAGRDAHTEPMELPGRDLHIGVHAGLWDFDDALRYEDEALYGLRAGAWLTRGLSLEVELEHMRTRNERLGDSARLYFMNIHGRLHYRPEAVVSPGILTGVSFMAADNENAENSITEGFDIGPALAVRLGQRTTLLAELLFRYTSVRTNYRTTNGEVLLNDEVQYVWNHGLRLGVDFAF